MNATHPDLDFLYGVPSFERDANFDPTDELNAPNIRDDADVVIERNGRTGTFVRHITITRMVRGRVRIYDADKISDASIARICNLTYGRYCEMKSSLRRPTSSRFVDHFGYH